MAQKLKVTYSDGRTVEVLASPKAQVAVERHFNLGMGSSDRLEHVYYLAWASLFHAGMEQADFETFIDSIDEIEALEGQETPDPSKTARLHGVSSA